MADRFFAVIFVGEYVHAWGIPAWVFLDERAHYLSLN
jgi:hypothetical protein